MLLDQSIIDILGDWSFWETPPPNGLTRQLDLPKQLHDDLVLIVHPNLAISFLTKFKMSKNGKNGYIPN